MTGYPQDFDISNYKSATVKITAYDQDGQPIKETTNLGDTKICANLSTDGTLYNKGWGNGFGAKFLNNLTPDSGTGEMTHTFTTLSKSDQAADCISYQIQGSKSTIEYMVISEIKFTLKD